jgi:uncharacterized membrane protein YkvA (DUF1232 family)
MKAGTTGFPLLRWFRQGLRNPGTRQWVLAGVLLYLISPIDLIPSFLPGLGEIDDVALLCLLLSELVQMWLGQWTEPADEFGSGAFEANPFQAPSTRPSPAGDRDRAEVVDVRAVPVTDSDE